MDDRDLAHMLLQNHFTAASALIALQMRHLPEEVQTRVMDAVRRGTSLFRPAIAVLLASGASYSGSAITSIRWRARSEWC